MKGIDKMNYVIKNHKQVFIRLNQNGAPVTCTEGETTLFEESKAKNILDNLPKILRRLSFRIEAVSDILNIRKKVIETENYVISKQISQWIEKFGICDDILKEVQKRKEELNTMLSNIDKEFSNLIHDIEFEGNIDLYGGWKERNEIKENRRRRRTVKDELIIISNVLRMDFRELDREIINKAVAGLAKRKFTYRVVEEDKTKCCVKDV